MHFSQVKTGNSDKITKIVIVTALHVAVAIGLINIKVNPGSPPSAVPDVKWVPEVIQPPKPVDPPPVTELAPPPLQPLTMPIIETAVTVTPPPDAIRAEPTSRPPVPPAIVDSGPPTTTVAPPAAKEILRTAVMAAGCAKPAYPARAARNGETGTVSLALLVGVNGKVTGSRIEKSSGSRDLDNAALNALSMCEFKAATKDGVPEQAWTKLAYVWTLDE